MAVTVVPNLTVVDTADTITGWSATSGQQDLEVKLQGTASYTYQTGKNRRVACTFTPAASIDMSGTGNHLYWWMRCDVFPFCELKTTGTTAPSGLTVRLTDGSNNFREWHVAGRDTWDGSWKCHAIALSNTSQVYAESSTAVNFADITQISWYTDNSNSGNIRIIDNTWIDVVRFGTGLTAYGTSFNYKDIEAVDQNSSNMYGIIQENEGILFVQGQITIDDNGSTTTFNSSNEVLAFRNLDVSPDVIYGTDNFILDFTGSGTTINISNLTSIGPDSIYNTPVFDASGTVGSFSMDGAFFNRMGPCDFKLGQDISNSKFVSTGLITPGGSTFDGIIIQETTGTNGALFFPVSVNNMSNVTFINNGSIGDIWIDTAGTYDFDAMFFDASIPHVYNSSGSTITINLLNGSNASTYIGSLVNFIASFTHTLTNLVQNTEVTYVKVSDGSVLFHVESVDATGETVYTHSGGDIVDILIHHINYEPDVSNIYGLTLPSKSVSVKIKQTYDVNYDNPV